MKTPRGHSRPSGSLSGIRRLSLRRFRAIFIKEYRHIMRDPRTLLLVTLAPGFLLLLLANIFRIDVQQTRFALWDMDRSPLSRRYVGALTADDTLIVAQSITSEARIDPLLKSGIVDFILIIPSGFGRELAAGRPAKVQAVFDATDSISAPRKQTHLLTRSAAFSKQVLLEGRELTIPLALRSVVWYNPALKSLIGMVPGLTPIVLSMPALAFAISLARERELGSFEGLITTPIRGAEYLPGKALAYIGLGTFSVIGAWLVAVVWFKIPFRGSFLLYLALADLYLAAMIGLVMMMFPILHTQQIAFFAVLAIFFVPSFFLTGLITPILKQGVRRLTSDVLPGTHFVQIARGVFVKGLGITHLVRPIIILALMCGVGTVIALLTFRKRLM